MQLLNATRTNLITNPSMEVDSTGWVPYADSGENPPPTLTVSASQHVSGGKSMKVQPGTTDGYTGAAITASGLTAGQTYRLSVYIKSA